MRNLLILLITLLFSILFSGAAMAIPQYYLFNGAVRSIDGDNTAMAVDQGFAIGKPVEFLFMVDAFVMGQVTYSSGKTDYDTLDIYAELISGSILEEIEGGYYLDDQGMATGNDANGHLTRDLHLANIDRDHQKQILIGNEDEHVIISSNEDGSWNGYLQAYDSSGRKASVHLDLNLTSITNEVPYPYTKGASLLPECSAMLFLGISLLVLAAIVHRIRRKQAPQKAITASVL